MKEERKVENGQEQVVQSTHMVVAGEETESTAVSDAQNTLDGFGGGINKFGFARVGHGRREIEEGLLTVLEVRWNDQFARVGKSKTTAKMLKASLNGERR